MYALPQIPHLAWQVSDVDFVRGGGAGEGEQSQASASCQQVLVGQQQHGQVINAVLDALQVDLLRVQGGPNKVNHTYMLIGVFLEDDVRRTELGVDDLEVFMELVEQEQVVLL